MNATLKLLSAAEILAAPDAAITTVEVPEWGGAVGVRGMTAEERDKFESGLFTGEGKDRKLDQANFRARLCSLCMVDDKGQRLFGEDDVKKLGAKSAKALDRVFDVAQAVCGIGQDKVEDQKKP